MTITCGPHWWICESPNGHDSIAVCKHCGERRVFSNVNPRDEEGYRRGYTLPVAPRVIAGTWGPEPKR